MGMRRLSCTISASNRKKIRTLGLLVVVGGSIGAAKNWNLARFPSLHHCKEGCLRHQENFAMPPKLTQTGWFSFCSYRKTTPSSLLRLRACALALRGDWRMLRNIFLIARPPLLAVMLL